ncbi:hypothetical protein F2Q69_00034153 [Brassica cretica]|uniref:Transposase MuDR plant domain-containing protein n=1 Tax=Brassica cretica TaxID=69181 RepID=A0A8S9SLY3_BRACR|nr:hypothetical protein F2Q69_00034153 [Brassica cretica]
MGSRLAVDNLPGSRLVNAEMMRQLHVVYGEWLLKDGCWNFVVDHFKGARMLFLNEGSTHADLVAMAQEDYNLDMNTESVELTYSLQQMAPDLPPIHVTSDRQVRNLLEITKTHEVRLCVSSFSKMRTVSEERDEAEDHDGEEDADIPVVADAEDYSEYENVKDEDEEEDDEICFDDYKGAYGCEGEGSSADRIYVNQSFACKDAMLSKLRLTTVRRRFSLRIFKPTKTLFVATCRVSGCQWKVRVSVKYGTKTFWVTKYVATHTCSIPDRIAQRKRCTPKYIIRHFIDRVGIIDGLNPQHIIDAMKNMFGMTLDYTTSYRALLYAQEMTSRKSRRLPGSPDDFQKVVTTEMEVVWKTSRKSSSALYFRLLTEDFHEVQTTSRKSRRLVKDEDEEEDDEICFDDYKGAYGCEGEGSSADRIYVNQSFASKDALLSELRLTAVRPSVKHGTKTFWVTKYVAIHTCSIPDRIAQRKRCTPKYIGRLFIDRVGIIDGLNLQHIKDAMKNKFGMTLDYTTSYRALLYTQEMTTFRKSRRLKWKSSGRLPGSRLEDFLEVV